jgi:transcriptional regulator with XRE-family HTH domain
MGLYLKECREAKGLTMTELARRMSVPPATVSQTEHAQRALKEHKIPMWAKGLDRSEHEIRGMWNLLDAEEVPPIVRKRSAAITKGSLIEMILMLNSAQRSRVCGYVEAVLEEGDGEDGDGEDG